MDSQDILTKFNSYKQARLALEEVWLESWAEWLSSDEAHTWLRASQFRSGRNTGNPDNQDWKHRLHTGKAFENIELVWAYFMQATFPSKSWFDITPEDLDDTEQAQLLKRFYMHSLTCSNFKDIYGDALRQALITGTTCIHVGLCPKTKKPKFTVIDNFDLFLEPSKPSDEANLIRRFNMPRRMIKSYVKKGKWTNISIRKVNGLNPSLTHSEDTTNKDAVSAFSNVSTDQEDDAKVKDDIVELLEYWGPIYEGDEYVGDGFAISSFDEVLHYAVTDEPRPYIVGTFITILNRAWAMSSMSPNLGMLHADRSFMNARLDNLLATIHNMWEVVEDGVVDTDFKFYPGAKIMVREPNSIKPVAIGQSNIGLTYQENQALQDRIDRNMGTVPSIGLGPQRKAERVTAEEITTSKEAGGTRLNQYHSHFERTFMNPLLQLYHRVWSKVPGYVKTVLSNSDGDLGQYELKPSQFCKCDITFTVEGSEAVLTTSSKVTRYVEFLNLALSSELLTAKVNVDYVLAEIVRLWGFDDPDKVLEVPEPEPAPEAPQESLVNQLDSVSSPAANYVESQMSADGGASLAQQMAATMNPLGATNGQSPTQRPPEIGLT